MLYENAPMTIRKAFDRQTEVLREEHGRLTPTPGGLSGLNLSDIYTIIIQETGRWCERYASDVLLDLDNLRSIADGHEGNRDEMLIFAMRRDGVDHIPFFMSRISQSVNAFNRYVDTSMYRRILAVRITVDEELSATCVLKKLDYSFISLEDEDRKEKA